MYQTLLVPLDGSEFAAHAIPVATDLARRTGAMVHLALVHDPSAFIPFVPGEVVVPVYDASLVQERRAADQAALDAAVASVEAHGVRVVGALLEGTVIESLIEYGQQVASELTIMTTHGRGGFERFRLGSVSTAYLIRATTPVLLLRGSMAGDHSALPHSPLMCPLDGTPFAEKILPHAAAFADACGITMSLFSVTTPHAVAMAPFATEALLADPSTLDVEVEQRNQYLERMKSECPPGTQVHGTTDMSIGRAIIDETARINAGVIAMATHARGGLMRFILGSVADEVTRGCDIPVLVYRPEESK